MLFKPKWVKLLPLNLRPDEKLVIKIEKLRVKFDIPHDALAMRILSSPTTTRRVQKQCLENFRAQNPGVSEKELFRIVFVSRIQPRESHGFRGMTNQEIDEAMKDINSIDELCDYIISIDEQEPAFPDSLGIGKQIDEILAEEEVEKKAPTENLIKNLEQTYFDLKKNHPDRMGSTWAQIVSNMFNSRTATELQLRAFCTYNILKDRIYTKVLSDVLEVLDNEGMDVESDIWITVWSKLTSAAIYLMTQTVLQYFKNKEDDADSFNILVFNTFLKDFNERKETLIEYERDNSSLGNSQVVWALGSQICKAVGREDAFLAMKITTFWEQIAKIEAETTLGILGASFDELKENMLKLNYVRMQKE